MNILYNDPHIVVVDKPGGLLAVPGRGPDKHDCVTARVRQQFPEMIEQPSVHRLDMYTSGVMVLAKTSEAHRNLSIQFEQRQTVKVYIAVIDGLLAADKGRIELKFRLDIDNRPYQIFDPDHGKIGITLWETIRIENNTTRIRMQPITGRTHQLRIHAAHEQGLGIPIVGDSLYGNGKEGDQMMLHAAELTLNHPHTGDTMLFQSNVPF